MYVVPGWCAGAVRGGGNGAGTVKVRLDGVSTAAA